MLKKRKKLYFDATKITIKAINSVKVDFVGLFQA